MTITLHEIHRVINICVKKTGESKKLDYVILSSL